jgi:hypothetical protein
MYEEMQDINDKTRKEGLAILARILAASIMHKYAQVDKHSTTPNSRLDSGGTDNVKPKGNDEPGEKP